MFIIKFNKMIRNKWVWGVFAVIVAGAFAFTDVGFMTGGSGRSGGVGMLEGEPVPAEEFEICRKMAEFLRNAGASRGDITVEREAWQIAAAMCTAEKLGITASDVEVGDFSMSQLSYEDGKYDAGVAARLLENMGCTLPVFEEICRRQIILSRLRSSVTGAAWESPSVVNEVLSGYNDEFTVTPAIVENTGDPAKVTVSEEDLESYYERTREDYRIPDQVAVRYVAFRANDYTSAVQVSEADMQDYYDANSHLYVSTDTNGVESVKPFEDVRDSIAAIFVDDAARRAAYEAAGKFADVFYSFDPAASVPDFDAEAARLGYTVVTTGLFSASSVPVRPSNPSEFAETAFSLLPRDGGNDSVSDAVFCGTESYVMALTTNVASYIPSLENVRLVVDNGVRREAVEREFRSKLDAVTEALALGLEKGGDFSAIAKEQGLKVETNMTFSVMSSYTKSDVPYARNIAGVMSGMDVGEFSAPIDIDNGAVIFRVADRQPPKDSSSIGMLGRQQIFGLLIPKKQELLWQSWLASNLSSMSFTTEMDVDGAGTEDYAE